jgi:hypothetical protein
LANGAISVRGTGAVVFGLAMLVELGGCRGRDVEFDCEYSSDLFSQQVEGAGELADALPDKGPYSAAMVLSAEGINKLLGGTVDDDVPFTGEVPFGPTTIFFEPENDPVIEIAEIKGCSNCIYYSIDFLVELGQDGMNFSTGTGNAKMAIPMQLEPIDGGGTKLIAAYEEAEIKEFEVTVYGLDSEEYEGMSEAISILMEENVKEQFGPTELLTFEPLGLGDGDVELAARELETFPEANSLALWLATNMKLPKSAALDIQPELPEELPMGMQFSTGLLLGMEQRMLEEGNVPRYYDRDGNPDEDGEFAVTIEDVEGSGAGDGRLDTIFRVWRLEGGYCGYAEADLPLFVEVDETDEDLRVVPGTVEVLRGKGVGSLAAEEDDVVADNQQLLDNFRGAVAKHMGLTINYDSLSITGKVVYFFTKQVDVEADALRSNLDFVVVTAP